MKVYFITKLEGTKKELLHKTQYLIEKTYPCLQHQICKCWEWHIYIPYFGSREIETLLKKKFKDDRYVFIYVVTILKKFNSQKLIKDFICTSIHPYDTFNVYLTDMMLNYKHQHNKILDYVKITNGKDYYYDILGVNYNIFDKQKEKKTIKKEQLNKVIRPKIFLQ